MPQWFVPTHPDANPNHACRHGRGREGIYSSSLVSFSPCSHHFLRDTVKCKKATFTRRERFRVLRQPLLTTGWLRVNALFQQDGSLCCNRTWIGLETPPAVVCALCEDKPQNKTTSIRPCLPKNVSSCRSVDGLGLSK